MPAAYLVGTISQPEIALSFDFSDVHATTGQPLQQWVKGLPGRRWDRSTSTWRVQCFGAMPTAALREAGIVCDPEAPHPERHESLNGVFDLDELVPPLVLAHETRSIAVVRMRFSGWDRTKRHLPLGAWWDKATQRFEVRLADLVQVDDAGNRSMWPNLIYMPGTAERALAASITEAPTDSSIATVAATAAMSTGLDLTEQAEEAVEALVAAVGEIPEDFTMNLYPYQRLGALAAAAGRGLLADSPGLGKTRQALAAAALRRSHRTVIVVPPVVVTNWVKETEESSLAKNCHGDIVMFRAGRKEPEFPDRGVVVIPDSLMVSRPHLVQKCIDWQPEVMVYDEAHRARNWTSKRSEVMRSFSEQLPTDTLRIAISGTPLFSQPHELAAILAITGHLDPVFGGYSNFLTEYSRQNHFKAWVAQKKKLPQLRQRLAEHVWVRRLKADVLKDLPPKSRVGVIVDIDLKDYRKAHDEVIEKIVDWLLAFWDEKAQETGVGRWPDEEEKDAWARQQIGLMSPLRKAAGVAKVPVALDMINDWVASNVLDAPAPDGSLYDRPLLVWAHHQEVIAALKDGIAAANKEVQVAVEIIDGATPAATRGAIVDRFQAGKIGVLIASNTAAGVGITLTRGSDMIFVETDWTPAIVSQCEDRCVFAGQPVMTKNGPKLIEDVVPGDVVLTHAGNWRAVTDAWSRSIRTNGYTGKTGRRLKTTISYQGAPFDLMVTNDHEVYAKKADGRIGWFEASTLLPGDYLATPKFKGSGLKSIVFPDRHRRWTSDEIAESRRCSVCGDPTIARGMCGIHYRQWCQQNRLDDGSLPPATGAPNARYTPAPEKIIVDDEFLNFCGWYVAEGFSSGRGKSKGSFVSFSLHEDERHVADRLAKYAERVFGARSSIYTKPTSRGIELRIYSSDLAEWFHAEFGHGARQKSLPSWIFDLDESQVKVFFDAYTQGDGHQRATANGEGRRNSWTTASDTLNDQMVLLAARLGQVPGSTYRAPFDRIIEGRPTSSGSAWVTEYTERDQCDEQVVWRRVSAVSTTTAKRDEKIYDLTVEGDESYVVGWAAVHNCARIGQEQPVICKTLIADDTLDQRIQKVLLTKAKVLNEVLGGTEADVAVAESEEDLVAPAEILLGLLKVAEPKAVKALKERAKAAV